MEISVNTRLNKGIQLSFECDLHITGMDINRLPSLNVDEIREMVRSQLESILRCYGYNKEGQAEEISRSLVYGAQRSQSVSEEDDKAQDLRDLVTQ